MVLIIASYGVSVALAQQSPTYLLFCDTTSCDGFTAKYSIMVSDGVLRLVNLDDQRSTYPQNTWQQGDPIPLLKTQDSTGAWAAGSVTDPANIASTLDPVNAAMVASEKPQDKPCIVSPHYNKNGDGGFALSEDIYNASGKITAHSGQLFTSSGGDNPIANSAGVYVSRSNQLVEIGPSNVGNVVPSLSGANVKVASTHAASDSDYGSEPPRLPDCIFASVGNTSTQQTAAPEVPNSHVPVGVNSIAQFLLHSLVGVPDTTSPGASCASFGLSPVCGSDGHTYTNVCYLDQSNVSQVGPGVCTVVVQSSLQDIATSGIPGSLLNLVRQTTFGVLMRGSAQATVVQ